MQGNNKTAAVVVTLVVGLLVGGGIGYMTGNNKDGGDGGQANNASSQSTDTKAAGLRVLLNNLNAQHADVASGVLRAGYDGSDQFAPSAKALDVNSVALSKSVGSVYGPEAEAKFLEIWRSHITFFVDYTVASKAGDQAGMDKAVQNLDGYVSAISDLLGGATGLPKDAVAQLIAEHVGLLKSTLDKHVAGDHDASYMAQQATRDQITTKIADTLAGAIVKQKPEAF
ncbi:hypothetical protein H0X10_03210 [Candidatus Saccharibacteria bacterium]|nr:hypothetical protein [Candidatus Saccharibacteria bacterium]